MGQNRFSMYQRCLAVTVLLNIFEVYFCTNILHAGGQLPVNLILDKQQITPGVWRSLNKDLVAGHMDFSAHPVLIHHTY